MSQTIKEREKELQNREAELKIRLKKSKDGLRSRLRSAGLIALVSGLVALVGYWIFRSFFSEDEPKTKKEATKSSNSFLRGLGGILTPYITNLLKELLESEDQPKETKGE